MEWDEQKRCRNIEVHKVDFADIAEFDWTVALTRQDTRTDYGEDRFVSIGPILDRLYVAVWTQRESGKRLISLRKANKREVRFYNDQ